MPRHVDGCGTRRRIQALCCLGWSGRYQARRLLIPASTLADALAGRRVSETTRDRVALLYDVLWNTPAPPSASATLTRRNATRRDWVPPMGWDDDDIDNPDAQPYQVCGVGGYDPLAVSIVVRERRPMVLRGPDRAEAKRQLLALGVRWTEIGELIGPPATRRPVDEAHRRRRQAQKVAA